MKYWLELAVNEERESSGELKKTKIITAYTDAGLGIRKSICVSCYFENVNIVIKKCLNQPKTLTNEQPDRKGKGTEKCGEHNNTGRKRSFVSHVFRHDIAADCSGGTKHDQNGNQFVVGKSKTDCNWKEDGTKADQLHKGAGNGCF